jgi:hypothetical protein
MSYVVLNWPCGQNPGRKPAFSRRVYGRARRRSLGEQDSTCRASTSFVPSRLRRERPNVRTFLLGTKGTGLSEQMPQDPDGSEQAGIEWAIRDLELEGEQPEDVKGGASLASR